VKLEAILQALEHNTGVFPRQALEAAIAQREAITPFLLDVLDRAAQDIEWLVDDESYMLHIYAMYLLAQFREVRAYPLVVAFFSIPGEITLDLTGDFVTESLGSVLASVSGGDMSLMMTLAENSQANEYVRNAAMRAMVCLVAQGIQPREKVMAYFQTLFRGGLEREYSYAWAGLVNCCAGLYPEEVMEDIRQAFANDLVDEMDIDLDWVERALARGKEAVLADLRKGRRYQLVNDTIKEMEWWACFKPAKT
jgi:hypothetical protein